MRERLTKPQQFILADLADDHYGLWEITGTVLGTQMKDVEDEQLQLIAYQALRDLLEGGWIELYEADEPHAGRQWLVSKTRALSLMDENDPWVLLMSREGGPMSTLPSRVMGRRGTSQAHGEVMPDARQAADTGLPPGLDAVNIRPHEIQSTR